MNLERLEYFAAVAEHLNFTRAADVCHVAQTAISRHIAALEGEVGCKLFYRTNRSVELTPAGKAFHAEIVPMLEHYRRALENARTAYSGRASSLRLGIGSYEMGVVSQLFREFHSLFPDIGLSVTQYPYGELLRKLEEGAADVVFPHPDTPLPNERRHISVHHMFSASPGLLVCAERAEEYVPGCRKPAEGRSMASGRSIQKKDLDGKVLYLLTESSGPMSPEHGKAQLLEAGLKPASIEPVNSLNALFLMVKAGLGAAFVPSFLETELPEDLILLPQKVLPPQSYCSIILNGSQNPAAELFSRGILTSQTVMEGIRKRYLRHADSHSAPSAP